MIVFDVLEAGGTELLARPYRERRVILEDLFARGVLAAPFTLCPATNDRATVLEVRAADRPGLVYTVCRAVADLGIAVRSAHVATLGPQAVDVFYVQEEAAGPLADDRAAAAAHAIRSALVAR